MLIGTRMHSSYGHVLGLHFVRAPGVPVVRGIDHQRVVVLADGAQSVHDSAYSLVDRLHRFELIDAKLVGVGLLLRRPGQRLDPRSCFDKASSPPRSPSRSSRTALTYRASSVRRSNARLLSSFTSRLTVDSWKVAALELPGGPDRPGLPPLFGIWNFALASSAIALLTGQFGGRGRGDVPRGELPGPVRLASARVQARTRPWERRGRAAREALRLLSEDTVEAHEHVGETAAGEYRAHDQPSAARRRDAVAARRIDAEALRGPLPEG